MPEHVLPDGRRTVTIRGSLIASSSSRTHPEKRRWAEYRLFRLASGGYVVAGVGRSAVPGETDRSWVRMAENPGAVIRAIEDTRGGVRQLSYMSRLLLDEAAENDRGMAAVWTTGT